MIRTRDISKAYGSLQALEGVGFGLERGSISGLLGANGAGKSTLFKILVGLIAPDAGRLEWEDRPVAFGDLEMRRRLGYVPEDDLLDDYLTVTEFLEFTGAVRGIAEPERGRRIDRWIEFFDLEDKRRTLLLECSHGMRRKASLAAALLAEPELLLLDEAMNGLDPVSRARLRAELRSRREAGMTILFSSHVIETIEPLCDRALILVRGRLVRDVPATDWSGPGKQASLEEIFLQATGQGGS